MSQPISPVSGQQASDATGQGQLVTRLEAENQALRARLAFLLEQVERNHAIMGRHPDLCRL